ncbi:ATP-binding protein [Clostridium paraputrificum]|uniref:ATP-binding protein n=1 Tax=Clostridium TaxID=1485 RepID=UPI003D333C60
MKVKKIRGEWKESGIRTDMCKYTFRNYEVWNNSSRVAKDTTIAYFSNYEALFDKRHNSIMLCGQVGSGKTHLAVALAINLLETRSKVIYMPYRDVITKIKQNMLDNEYYSKVIDKYKTCEVLLIDDLFKGKVNDSDINIMFEIINYRYLNCLPIIVSSEFTIEKLLTFDESVGSRIYEMCKKYIVEIKKDINNNYRLR